MCSRSWRLFVTDEYLVKTQGAGHIAEYLLGVYGEDGFAMLVDEGGGYLVRFPWIISRIV